MSLRSYLGTIDFFHHRAGQCERYCVDRQRKWCWPRPARTGAVRLWEIAEGRLIGGREIKAHRGVVTSVSAGYAESFYLWRY